MALTFNNAHNPGDQLTSTEWNTLCNAVAAGLTNVKHHGATGNGVNDDTAAIKAAWTASGGRIFFPPGSYRYTETGLDVGLNSSVEISGAGVECTTITLGSGSYLVNTGTLVSRLYMSNLDVQQGKGLFRQTYTGANVYEPLTFENLRLYGYTEAAISNECVDSPYLRLYNVMFQGANTTTTMGLAWSGYGDQTKIVDCQFLKNRICMKFRRPVNIHADNCDLLQYSTDNSAGARVGVWIVPTTTLVPPGVYGDGGAGYGSVFREFKFGAAPAEQWLTTDYRFLFADEGAGATIGTKMPVTGSDSTGYVQAILIDSPYLAGGAMPIIYSTTPNVAQMRGRDPIIYDAAPTYWLQYRTPPTVNNADRTGNRFDQPRGGGGSGAGAAPYPAIPLTNATHGGVWDSSMTAAVPASASAAGVPGQRAYDASYEYRCVAANTWKRTALATW